MRKGRVLVILLIAASATLVITSAGWYSSAREGDKSEHFDSCRVEDGRVVLGYVYGLDERVTLGSKPVDDGVEVSLKFESVNIGEAVRAIGLLGEFRPVVDDPASLVYPDGEKVDCEAS